jgi:hypothetical protein
MAGLKPNTAGGPKVWDWGEVVEGARISFAAALLALELSLWLSAVNVLVIALRNNQVSSRVLSHFRLSSATTQSTSR